MINLFILGEKGHSALSAILEKFGSQVISQVVCARDPGLQNDFYEDIQKICLTNQIPFVEKKHFKKSDSFSFAIGWRWLIECPEDKLIIFHDSLLPKYRGFNPLVTALIAGDREIGVTALFGEKEFDKGEIISQEKIAIDYPLKISDAIKSTLPLYNKQILTILSSLREKKEIVSKAQDEGQASYSLWRDEDDYRIDWSLSATVIKRQIDALGTPYKGASALMDEKLVRIIEAEVFPDVIIANRAPGKVLFVDGQRPVIVCGTGLIKIVEAKDDLSHESIVPLKNFRIKFK